MNYFNFGISSRSYLNTLTAFICTAFALSFLVVKSHAAETLSVEKVHGNSGTIASAELKPMDDRLYVSGLVRINQPYQPSPGLHVDIYLVGKDGQIIGQEKSRIVVTSMKRDRTRGGRFPYAVSFGNDVAAKAASVRVVYCPSAHPNES